MGSYEEKRKTIEACLFPIALETVLKVYEKHL